MSLQRNNTTFSDIAEYTTASVTCSINSIDSVWVGLSSLLVMLMTPSVGFMYSGLVNQSGMSSMLGLCFSIFAIVSLLWSIIGYSLVYGDSQGGMIGNLRYAFLNNLSNYQNKCLNQFSVKDCVENKYYWDSCGIPEFLFFFFQSKFAGITPVLVIGSISERMYLKYSLIFISIWHLIVYCPLSHWVWNAHGFLHKLGVRDYAGGIVIHVASGFSALVTSIILGKRKSYGTTPDVINFPFTILGTTLLWFGWFGFNGGSSYKLDQVGLYAIVNTNLSATISLVVWIVIDLCVYKRISALGISMGVICGLVAVTPGAGDMEFRYALLVGLIASIICWVASYARKKFNLYDDLDVFTVHGVAGVWGNFATGFFASKQINPYLSMDGLIYTFNKEGEDQKFVLYQFVGVVVVIVYSSIMTYIILFFLKKCFNIRAKSDEEIYYDHVNFFDEHYKITSKTEKNAVVIR